MTNRPRRIGTSAETAVVKALQRLGFEHATRVPLSGNHDRGDIHLNPGSDRLLLIEAKGGAQGHDPGDALLASWLDQLAAEISNAGAVDGILVCQRRGVGPKNAERWWAWHTTAPHMLPLPARMTLADTIIRLRWLP